MQPKISVIVPVYKVEKYIKKCVDSLLIQTYQNMEIILVDDGSPDECPSICDEYACIHDNITVYHKKNGGLSSARNYGVKKAQSEWIVFVDSDDYVESSYVEDLWNLRNKFHSDMSIIRIVRENEDGSGRPAPITDFKDYCADNKTALFEVYKAETVGWSAYGKLIKRNNLLENPFPNGYYEDCACMYRLIENCDVIAIGNYEMDYHYINRQGSILQSTLKKEHFRIFEICDEFNMYINEKYPDYSALSVIFYRLAVTQMLNCQIMTKAQYDNVYIRYRKFFRSNLMIVLKDSRLSCKQKYFMVMHCLTPTVFKMQRLLLVRIRKS